MRKEEFSIRTIHGKREAHVILFNILCKSEYNFYITSGIPKERNIRTCVRSMVGLRYKVWNYEDLLKILHGNGNSFFYSASLWSFIFTHSSSSNSSEIMCLCRLDFFLLRIAFILGALFVTCQFDSFPWDMKFFCTDKNVSYLKSCSLLPGFCFV